MELTSALTLARTLMDQHGLERWKLKTINHATTFGMCNNYLRIISLSTKLIAVNDEDEVRDTILHEIAHALVPATEHHGPVWKAKARELGCREATTYADKAAVVPGKYTLTCPECGWSTSRHRKTTSNYACTPCCNTYNHGKYSNQYKLVWQQNY